MSHASEDVAAAPRPPATRRRPYKQPDVSALLDQPVRAWLLRARAATADRGRIWSFERMANEAGISSTTITRFIKDGSPIPKLTTLRKIARAVGVPAPDEFPRLSGPGFVDVPVILPQVLMTLGSAAAIMQAIDFARVPSRFAGCVALRVTADTGSHAGILPGDLVVVDQEASRVAEGLVAVVVGPAAAPGVGIFRLDGEASLSPEVRGRVIGLVRLVQREVS